MADLPLNRAALLAAADAIEASPERQSKSTILNGCAPAFAEAAVRAYLDAAAFQVERRISIGWDDQEMPTRVQRLIGPWEQVESGGAGEQ